MSTCTLLNSGSYFHLEMGARLSNEMSLPETRHECQFNLLMYAVMWIDSREIWLNH